MTLQGRQVLYAEGHHFPCSEQVAGFNIYLDGGRCVPEAWPLENGIALDEQTGHRGGTLVPGDAHI